MANFVGGSKILYKDLVTATANLPGKTLCTIAGAVPANAANTSYGVVMEDTANTDSASVIIDGIAEVVATGTVTAGLAVEVLQAATFKMNINGTATASQTGAGVVNSTSGYIIGRALTSGSANDTVLVRLFPNTFLKLV